MYMKSQDILHTGHNGIGRCLISGCAAGSERAGLRVQSREGLRMQSKVSAAATSPVSVFVGRVSVSVRVTQHDQVSVI
jgi:hypothetical protein